MSSTSTIVVQPPQQVATGQILYPPLVVRCPPIQDWTFYQVVFLGVDGSPVGHNDVGGTFAMNPRPLADATSSSGSTSSSQTWEYIAFPDLVINRTGSYCIQVNAFQMDYTQVPPSAHCTEQLISRDIRVHGSEAINSAPSTVSPLLKLYSNSSRSPTANPYRTIASREGQLLTLLTNDGNFSIPQPPQ
jgi:hypothetical protein